MNLTLLFVSLFLFSITSFAKKHRHKHKHKHHPSVTTSISSGLSLPTAVANENNCPCAASDTNSPCRGGIYVDYYYNAPYSGYPANSSYLPPVDSVPVILEKLTKVRDIVKEFVQGAKEEDSEVKRAVFVKNNFGKVQFVLQAINKAANATESK